MGKMTYIIISADSTQTLQQEVNTFLSQDISNGIYNLCGGPFYDNHGYHQAVYKIDYFTNGEKQILKD